MDDFPRSLVNNFSRMRTIRRAEKFGASTTRRIVRGAPESNERGKIMILTRRSSAEQRIWWRGKKIGGCSEEQSGFRLSSADVGIAIEKEVGSWIVDRENGTGHLDSQLLTIPSGNCVGQWYIIDYLQCYEPRRKTLSGGSRVPSDQEQHGKKLWETDIEMRSSTECLEPRE